MSSKTGLVLGFFRDDDTAAATRKNLRRAGFTRIASIQKGRDNHVDIRATRISDNLGTLLGGVSGLAVSALSAWPLGRLPLQNANVIRGVTIGAGGVIGAAGGRLLARHFNAGVSPEIVQLYSRWIVSGETLIIVKTSRDDIEDVLGILRADKENLPVSFVVRPHLRDENALLQKILRKDSETAGAAKSGTMRLTLTARDERPQPLVGDALRDHAQATAKRHAPLVGKGRARTLLRRLRSSERIINGVCRGLAEAARLEQPVSLSAEWLLDNAYIIARQIADVRRNLTSEFYAELPVLVPKKAQSEQTTFIPLGFAHEVRGVTRAYSVARDLVNHVDGRLDEHNIHEYVSAYQKVLPLTMGELWALPLLLRLALIENLRRLTMQTDLRQRDRERADFWANRLLAASRSEDDVMLTLLGDLAKEQPQLGAHFADRLISGLYDEETALVLVRSWVERKLNASLGDIVAREGRRQAADQISVANTIGSLRVLGEMDWRETFESLSVVHEALENDLTGTYPNMDFATRDRYRHQIERIARGTQRNGLPSDLAPVEISVARRTLDAARNHLPSKLTAPSTSIVRADTEVPQTWEIEDGEVPRGHIGFHLLEEGVRNLEHAVDYRPSFKFAVRRWITDHPAETYFGTLGIGTLTASGAALWLARRGAQSLGRGGWGLGALAIGPASELAVQGVHFALTKILEPVTLPKMSFEKSGIPDEWRTLVVVPMMLSNEDAIRLDAERLEVRYLANSDANLRFALLSDFSDATQRIMPEDAAKLLAAQNAIAQLNRRYGPVSWNAPDGSYQEGERFLLFGRERRWSETEQKWMGWERKRGKLEELNELLCGYGSGALDALHAMEGNADSLEGVRLVITLDADTQLPRDTARRMIETLAHPLNRPVIVQSPNDARPIVERGYTVVQPRVSTSLPSATATRFSRLFTDATGSDPYTHAISDVYQDTFGEGSYHGKGIYDVRAFQQVLAERFPPATLLSHDLLEGAHVRVGLASDIELFDEFPPTYLAYARRNHRWLRGDWQIVDWIRSTVPATSGRAANALSLLNKWKVGDNLRRSELPIASCALLSVSWLLGPSAALAAGVLVGADLLVPSLTQFVNWLPSRTGGVRVIARELGAGFLRAALQMALVPYEAYLSLDAIVRTLYRRNVSHQQLLEWQTAQANYRDATTRERDFQIQMGAVSLWAGINALVVGIFQTASLPFATPFLISWTLAPIAVRWLSGGRERAAGRELNGEQQLLLRRIARQTWRYFDDFVGPQTHWLPPDNYQEALRVEIAQRTSPTNIGLWLLSLLAAHDFGYLPLDEVVLRSQETLDTLDKMERFHGHFYNWYDVQNAQPLRPRYISAVDSGNFLGALWTHEQGLNDLQRQPLLGAKALNGLMDVLGLLRESLGAACSPEVRELADQMEHLLSDPIENPHETIARVRGCEPIVARLIEAVALAHRAPSLRPRDQADMEATTSDPRFATEAAAYWAGQLSAQTELWRGQIERYLAWVELLRQLPDADTYRADDEIIRRRDDALKTLPSLEDLAIGRAEAMNALLELRARTYLSREARQWLERLSIEFGRARWFAGEMNASTQRAIEQMQVLARETDMRFLFDEERELFAIGFNVEDLRRDNSYYDLLASECRLASFVCIARGEVPLEHWVALGRRYGLAYRRAALQSWSGTMFEYLMPVLLMKPFQNSMLEDACRTAVLVQADYGRERNIPWGISEAAHAALDTNKTYQYHAFGVPGLGLKRGLQDDLVVAPYATVLALMLEPQRAVRNLKRLSDIGMRGDYGFYESIDYSRQRMRDNDPDTKDSAGRGAIVRCFMAHHQGMSLLSLDNVLHDGAMQNRFHADPRVQSAEPLLQERIPVAPPVLREILPERPPARLNTDAIEETSAVDRLTTPDTPLPRVQLLSNGSYSLMVTGAGGGYSRRGDIEITRWRADSTRDSWGQWIYLRDEDNNVNWSAAHQPLQRAPRSASVLFTNDKAEFTRRGPEIETTTEIIVSPDEDAEIRRVTLVNHSNRERFIQVTTFAEVALAAHDADRAHPAFAKLFVQTDYDPNLRAVLAWRRPRSSKEDVIWAAHALIADPQVLAGGETQFETDRAQFLGRDRGADDPQALWQPLSGTTGAVLDPCFALRQRVRVAPGARVSLSFVTTCGDTREQVLSNIEKLRDGDGVRRAFEAAWTYAQLELHQLRIQPEEAQRFQQLAGHMLFPYFALRAPAKRIRDNHLGQKALWAYGISGDLPILVVTIDDRRDINVVRQALAAHTFWRLRGFKADLVILNEQAGGYNQDLTEQLSNLALSMSHHVGLNQPGGIFLRTADTLPEEDLNLLFAVARVVLVAPRGGLARQLLNLTAPPELPPRLRPTGNYSEEPSPDLPFMTLPYFNGKGGFTEDGREYAVYLERGSDQGIATTPAPWSNVIANPDFGMLVSEAGQGFAWSGNSQSNRLTPWSNDPVSDVSGDAIYIRDEDTGTFWTPTPLPIRENDPYRARHGQGYSIFEHNSHAIEQELTFWVPTGIEAEDAMPPCRVQTLKLRNRSSRRRRLSVTCYVEWILGTTREETQSQIVTQWDTDAGILLAHNKYHPDFGSRVAWLSSVPPADSFTADRTSFLGRNGSPNSPDALRRKGLSERTGAGLDACGALQVLATLEPGEEREITFVLGESDNIEDVHKLVAQMRAPEASRKYLQQTRDYWDNILGALQVQTPILSVDLLLNRWLVYQTLSCRLWGRSAFYQSGGAYGFRDQLQDVMALVYSAPQYTREQIVRASAHQFPEGDVQHWWHPPGDAGVRTLISDDLLFLPYVTAHYIRATGDVSVLDEVVPFLGGEPLKEGEHETYMAPEPSTQSGTVFEHCRRAIQKGCTKGPHNLPLIGAGDWNDGMNRVGIEGKGESVWLAWFAIQVLNDFAEVCSTREETTLARQYRAQAKAYAVAVEKSAWDGDWYLRAFFDDGTPLGSHLSDEAKIDALPQSWSVLSGAGDPERSAQALQSLEDKLVLRDEGMILLFTPAYDKSTTDPGYIKGYLPGVRENGGQYTHAAVWSAMSFARAGHGTKAVELLTMLNPVEHARTPEDVDTYKVEPYVVCADIYNLPGHVGRGGWTWYTGSASWMYRAWIEEVLGFGLRADSLQINPTVPTDWTQFGLRYRHKSAHYQISVQNPDGVENGVLWIEVDGKRIRTKAIPLVDDGETHRVTVRMGARKKAEK